MYQKIKQIATKGMYYIDGDKFILENIEKNSNDFKISITINNMKEFLKLNLSNL